MKRLAILAAAMLAALATPAAADAIDGNWCSPDGRHFFIQGPSIVTEDGVKLTGDYNRHAFSYVIPAPNRLAGQRVRMVLRGEFLLNLRVGDSEDSPIEAWKRCEVTS